MCLSSCPPTMSPDAMLHWRDHHALQTVVHVVVESALARISDDAVAGVLDEIRQAVLEALDSHDFVKAAMRPTTPSGCPELLSCDTQVIPLTQERSRQLSLLLRSSRGVGAASCTASCMTRTWTLFCI
ncbi:hypothetical protein EXIGLDRAFT_85245 [Exidia glandulosa HHB12029]|uniref:Uncharacterized protein n=1 Tax=Exidia glandulosa HHB12029 TaxID=1314781 RepID=A0A165HFC2_EXIGL|nr:hypothetical protein EXIGLDRAFT_85245 [Exidia glandulosa HHB12029]